jgi:hypothetical protein
MPVIFFSFNQAGNPFNQRSLVNLVRQFIYNNLVTPFGVSSINARALTTTRPCPVA